MNDTAAEQTLRDELRARPARGTPSEIVARALDLGLGASRAVNVAFDRYSAHAPRQGTGLAALIAFVRTLARNQAAPILEYSASHQWISLDATAGLANLLTLVSPSHEMIEALNIAHPQSTHVHWSLDSKPDFANIVNQTLMICAPPIGMRRVIGGDGFGGEVLRALLPKLNAGGRALWLTTRGAVFTPRALHTHEQLAAEGWSMEAMLDVTPGAMPDTLLEMVLFCYRKAGLNQRLVGSLRSEIGASEIADALLAGPRLQAGDNWQWVPANELKTYREIAQERLITRLRPKGRSRLTLLRDLVSDEPITKADRVSHSAGAAIYIPEYTGSRVSALLEEQTVRSKAVYRLPIDENQVSAQFLAHLFNTPYGRELRSNISSGITIQRVSLEKLLELKLPIPNQDEQDKIVRSLNDLSLISSRLAELGEKLSGDWSELERTQERVERLLSVLDLNRQIADWWQELPYPLATVYRRYRVEAAPKEQLEALLHFFELTAIYLAIAVVSHAKELRPDASDALTSWLWPDSRGGLARPDFGYWTTLAATGLKDLRRTGSDPVRREAAIAHAGPHALQSGLMLETLSPAIQTLEKARDYRNRYRGHGGYLKASDAAHLLTTLEPLVRELYEHTARAFRNLLLIRTGSVEITADALCYSIQTLAGSDPTFASRAAEVDTRVPSRILAFWSVGSRWICPALPLLRIGAPDRPEDRTCYVYNRAERDGVRWVSYQDAAEQELTSADVEVQALLDLGQHKPLGAPA